MSQITEGTLLWSPTEKIIRNANITRYMSWLLDTRGLSFETYHELWHWSVTEPADFWRSIWDYFEVKSSAQPSTILEKKVMPGATWFPKTRLNYAENFFARVNENFPAILYKAEDKDLVEVSWSEIKANTIALAFALRSMGVERGDRVVAYMPNIPETITALFAVASLGAIWSSCSPDFGSRSVLDRFEQIRPKILITVDGYQYNGKIYDRRDVLTDLQAGLPTLEKTVVISQLLQERATNDLQNAFVWDELLVNAELTSRLKFEQVPFDHPLWILYSSGTTGLPKPIVQGHGGILLEHLKMVSLHLDLKAGDRFFWYTSTGWMMWNLLVGGLLAGATIVDYDGSPGYPDLHALWKLAEETKISYFGTSAAFIDASMKAGIRPSEHYDLSHIQAVGSTGSPLTVDGFQWIYENVNNKLALESVSGGTDLCTAFVGGCRLQPVYAGEIQVAALGAWVQAYNENGEAVVDEVGELVITEPMPSMPLYLWNDPDDARYISSYFDMYPGVWRHGDWIKFNKRGGSIIYGRSDSTINRQGVRMGTSEIYRVVEAMPAVQDSLVVDLELLGRESFMALFVVLGTNVILDDALKQKIKQNIREKISPRYVPNEIYAIDQVPYTLSGKKMEVPVRRILIGHEPDKAINPGAMKNPESIQYFIKLAGDL